jgi:hypothetical protein
MYPSLCVNFIIIIFTAELLTHKSTRVKVKLLVSSFSRKSQECTGDVRANEPKHKMQTDINASRFLKELSNYD